MQTWVVERYLTGWPDDEVGALLERLDALASHFAAHHVEYVQSMLLAGDETCLSVFHGADAEHVRRVNLDAGLPTDRVIAATVTAGAQGSASS